MVGLAAPDATLRIVSDRPETLFEFSSISETIIEPGESTGLIHAPPRSH
jgi:hypothetical protein